MRSMFVLAVLALVSCDRSPEPSLSLVGARAVTSAEELHKETLIITRSGGTDWGDLLNVEILPSDQIVVSHYRGGDQQTPIARENLRMPAADAEKVRRMLRRLRPDSDAPASKTVPLGCDYVYDAGFEWGVAYYHPDRPADLRLFGLPAAGSCNPSAYAEAMGVITTSMRSLPRSRVIEQFPSGRTAP
jgi:hypothetical protein